MKFTALNSWILADNHPSMQYWVNIISEMNQNFRRDLKADQVDQI